jgi:penicillin-binding protein 1A
VALTSLFKRRKFISIVILIVGAAAFLALLIVAIVRASDVPDLQKVEDYRPLGVTQVVSIDQGKREVIAQFFKERRYVVSYDQIPQKLVQAFVSAEDSQFFTHSGVNYLAILRAAVANFKAGHVVQGGSTITQQIAKSMYLSPERNIIRKIRELQLALKLEENLSKEEILYLYLNQIYLGSGSYGVSAAAQTYFRKELKSLTVAEMALIAGLPTAPGKYSPLLNPEKAKERQQYVLRRMEELGHITPAEREAAVNQVIRIYARPDHEEGIAPHFIEQIRRYLVQKYGEKAVYEEGMTIVIPGAKKSFEYAADALQEGLEDVDKKRGYRGPIAKIAQGEWDSKKEDLIKKFLDQALPYRNLKPSGVLDAESAVKEFDPNYSKAISKRKFEALILEVDDVKEIAIAQVGPLTVEVPVTELTWAHPEADPKFMVRKVSDVLSAGDLVYLRVDPGAKPGQFKGRLTQVPQVQGALYSVDIKTGQILAMVGSYDFSLSEFNRVTQAKRQMGSTFKPFIFASAIEHGLTPATVIVDSPIVYQNEDLTTWKPENYDEKFYGDTLLRQALIASRNIPTIKVVQELKVPNIISFAHRVGFESNFAKDLSIALGSSTASLDELVHAFTTFPLLGKSFTPILYEKISSRDGTVLETFAKGGPTAAASAEDKSANATVSTGGASAGQFAPTTDSNLRLDPRVSYVMTHLMKEVVEFGTARRATTLGGSLAGKTGTTQDSHDAWFVGYSPRYVTGVWVGYDDQRNLGKGDGGSNIALPIWIRYMRSMLKDTEAEEFVVPEGVTMVSIDPKTGKQSNRPSAVLEAFVSGTEPGAQQKPSQIGQASPGSATDGVPSEPEAAAPAEDEFLKEQ